MGPAWVRSIRAASLILLVLRCIDAVGAWVIRLPGTHAHVQN
eukprot:COSAG02_NODE_25151_length_667_cov_1.411972_2_plen_41_part_01